MQTNFINAINQIILNKTAHYITNTAWLIIQMQFNSLIMLIKSETYLLNLAYYYR